MRPRILYVVYWGAAEPLGRSLVVPAVCRLAELGAVLTLVTFEKPVDLAREDDVGRLRSRLEKSGVRWTPLRYHKWPKWPATGFDMLHGLGRGLWARRVGPIDIVHARTFVAGLVGWGTARLLGVPFVYHNEGFYADEQIDGGVWSSGSVPHRLATWLERRLYTHADGIIVLSRQAQRQVAELAREGRPILVVPSAVDLDRFQMRPAFPARQETELRLVYLGSVGQRYLLDRIGRFVSILASRTPTPTFLRVVSAAPTPLVGELLARGGLSRELWSSAFVPHEGVADELRKSHAGLHFLNRGLSEHGGSPAKFGEYWASGLPVVTTPNVSDSEEIIQNEGVGVIVRQHTDDAYREAADELLSLLADPDLQGRCRRAAENHYSLERACQEQVALYRRILRAEGPARSEQRS